MGRLSDAWKLSGTEERSTGVFRNKAGIMQAGAGAPARLLRQRDAGQGTDRRQVGGDMLAGWNAGNSQGSLSPPHPADWILHRHLFTQAV
jgi:hypothetical protein